VSLSQYNHPHELPNIEFKDHSFFVETVCQNTKKCPVAAWYDNNGTIYLDKRLEGHEDPETRSLIVHEMTHYLQDLSGKYPEQSCDDHVYREREAYAIQRKYLRQVAQLYIAIYQNYPPCVDLRRKLDQ
ncbi:MAG: hypothetical protein MI673_09585, partial [Thiotrichales bacterium]|nr:hypothetical protein [Thiotrichales bacterium]